MADGLKKYADFYGLIYSKVSVDRILVMAMSNLTSEILALRLNVKNLYAHK